MRLPISLACLALLSGPALAAQQDQVSSQTPKALLDWIYGANRGQANDDGDKARLYFTADIVALKKRWQALADTGQLDAMADDAGDFCSCQDVGDTSYRLKVTPQGTDRAQGDVTYVNQGITTRYRYVLRLTPAGWRIADLAQLSSTLDHGRPPAPVISYKQGLVNEIKAAEKTKPHTY